MNGDLTISITLHRDAYERLREGREQSAIDTVVDAVAEAYDEAVRLEQPLGPGDWIKGDGWLDVYYWHSTVAGLALLGRMSDGKASVRMIDADHSGIERARKPEWGDDLLTEL